MNLWFKKFITVIASGKMVVQTRGKGNGEMLWDKANVYVCGSV